MKYIKEFKEYININDSINENKTNTLNTDKDGYLLDSNNEKLSVFHGSLDNNVEFVKGSLAFFTDYDCAKDFANIYYLTGTHELVEGEVPTIYEAHIKVKNPLILTTHDEYEDIMMGSTALVGEYSIYDYIIYLPEDKRDAKYYAIMVDDNNLDIISKTHPTFS